MAADDARAYLAVLKRGGLRTESASGELDVVVCDDKEGPWSECEWLSMGKIPIEWEGEPVEVSAVWLTGRLQGRLVMPADYSPTRVGWMSTEEFYRDYEHISTDGGVQAWRHKTTGELRYIGRPAVLDGQRLEEAVAELKTLVWSLAEPMTGTLSADAVLRLEAAIHRALELEKAMPSKADLPLLRGVAARRLGKWSDAEPAFRRLTELAPNFVGGWLDLTWSLAEQKRHAEAVIPATRATEIDPKSAAAWGNLAAVYLQMQQFNEANDALQKSMQLDPKDAISLRLKAQLDKEWTPAKPAPWWRRWFG
jgi:tetratricopeptide (TPR) repeat protein